MDRHIVDRHAFLYVVDFNHSAQGIDAGIEIGLGGIEVAGKIGRNLLRNLALAEAAEKFRGHGQRRGERVQRLIEILEQLAFFRLEAIQPRPLMDFPERRAAVRR